ncbi:MULTISPECIES: XRE family transcriptional regulator [Pseudomonas]|uniref:XRE family transcriptional regulator n=1 Tax=Pseudomonas TaxID=286 RepID=UPI0015B76A0F|nr:MULTISPECIES: XRE family transcriptional regulator [Pseudomonas]
MKHIDRYRPPAPADLLALKKNLEATSQEMATLAGLTQGSQWRKYTGTAESRPMNKHMHFYMASLLTLSEADIERVTATMRAHGADVTTAQITLASGTPLADNDKPSLTHES